MIYQKHVNVGGKIDEVNNLMINLVIHHTKQRTISEAEFSDGVPFKVVYAEKPDYDIEVMHREGTIFITIHDDIDNIWPETDDEVAIGEAFFTEISFGLDWLNDGLKADFVYRL